MSEKETFFLDTNVLIKWIYRKLLNEIPDIERFINSLNKEQCIILDIVLSEFEAIINYAYTMTSHIIYEKILRESNWDKLSIEEKYQILDNIRKNFTNIYEELRQKYYNGQILPHGIRQILAKTLLTNMNDKILSWSSEELKRHIILSGRVDDLIDYITSIEYKIGQRCIIYEVSNLSLKGNIIIDLQLIDEGIRNYLNKLKKEEYRKTPSRNDQLIFKLLFSLLYERIYDKIIFITDDNDFERMYREILSHLSKIINNKADSYRSLKEHAKETYDILSKQLILKRVNELRVNE